MAPTTKELMLLVEELQAQNAELARRLTADGAPLRRRRRWTWTLASVAMISIGALLAPAAVIANWTRIELTNTDEFVATFSPLAKDPEVQAFVIEQTTTAINNKVDIPGLTAELFSGIKTLGLPPRAVTALGALQGAAAAGAQNLVTAAVTKLVTSDAFAKVFARALRVTHTQLIGALQGSPHSAISLTKDTVSLELGPIVAKVKTMLVSGGLSFASAIPTIHKSIVLARSDQLASAQQAYALAVFLGIWAPWLMLAFLLIGIIVARRRRLALVWASFAVTLSMGATILAIDGGKTFVVTQLAATLPPGVSQRVFEQITEYSRHTALVLSTIAILVGLTAWFAGPATVPTQLRHWFQSGARAVRGQAERNGLLLGQFGRQIDSIRIPIRFAIAAVSAAAILFVRPLDAALITITLVLSLITLFVLETVRQPIPETVELVDSTPA